MGTMNEPWPSDPLVYLGRGARVLARAAEDASLADALKRAAHLTIDALREGGTLFVCGNGGSAAESTHFTGELVGAFADRARPPIRAIPLGFDVGAITAMANDFTYEAAFGRQLEALARKGDVLWALSTSGRSKNILATMRIARALGMPTVLFTNDDGADAVLLSDVTLRAPSSDTPHVQELHLAFGHWLCGEIEQHFKA
jgi:D-sedoheptulose 7-phosphate isomerase